MYTKPYLVFLENKTLPCIFGKQNPTLYFWKTKPYLVFLASPTYTLVFNSGQSLYTCQLPRKKAQGNLLNMVFKGGHKVKGIKHTTCKKTQKTHKKTNKKTTTTHT
jgi:hypothetical protein